jgi:hypothetical protein
LIGALGIFSLLDRRDSTSTRQRRKKGKRWVSVQLREDGSANAAEALEDRITLQDAPAARRASQARLFFCRSRTVLSFLGEASTQKEPGAAEP